MKFVFTGDPTELEAERGLSRTSTVMFGKHFPMGAEVDCSDLSQDQLRKLAGNREFMDASEAASRRTPLIIPASAAASVAADVGDGAGAADEAPAKRKAKG